MSKYSFDLAKRNLPKGQKELNSLCLRWYEAVLFDPTLRGAGVLKAAWIIQNSINIGRGYGWPSFEHMAQKAGMDGKTFQRAVTQLEGRNLIQVSRKRGRSNRYVINPFMAAVEQSEDTRVPTSDIENIDESPEPRTPTPSPDGQNEELADGRDLDVPRPGTLVSSDHGHPCPPNIPKNISNTVPKGAQPRASADESARAGARPSSDSVVIRKGQVGFDMWIAYWRERGDPEEQITEVIEHGCARVPSQWPPEHQPCAA